MLKDLPKEPTKELTAEPPKQSRFARRKQETKSKIFAAAMDLFLTQGFEKTTIEQITEKADVARGTFFNHFPTKEAVLAYLGEYRVAMLAEVMAEELAQIHSAKEKIRAILRVLSRENEEHKEVTRLIIWESFSKGAANLNQEKTNQLQFNVLLQELVAQGQEQGQFRDDFHPRYAADILAGTYYYILLHWLEDNLSHPLEEALIDSAEIIFHGINA